MAWAWTWFLQPFGNMRSRPRCGRRPFDLFNESTRERLRLTAASCLKQEPCSPLGLVDPGLEQACAGDVSLLVAKAMRLAQAHRELLVVVAQLGKHIQGGDEV